MTLRAALCFCREVNMRTRRAQLFVTAVSALLIASPHAVPGAGMPLTQCQGQECEFNDSRNCFVCVAAPDIGCQVVSCDRCTVTRCKPGCCQPLPASGSTAQAGKCQLAPLLLTSQPAPQGHTGVGLLEASQSPATLAEITATTSDLFSSGKLKNTGTTAISSYQIGWIITYPDGRQTVQSGPAMNVPALIPAGSLYDVPPQAVTGFLRRGVRRVDFFVFSATMQTGQQWKADLEAIRKQAAEKAGAIAPLPK